MGERLTTSKVAERVGVRQPTVRLCCRRGRFPNAELAETPRGPVWMIPESDKASGPDGRVVVTKKGGKKR